MMGVFGLSAKTAIEQLKKQDEIIKELVDELRLIQAYLKKDYKNLNNMSKAVRVAYFLKQRILLARIKEARSNKELYLKFLKTGSF